MAIDANGGHHRPLPFEIELIKQLQVNVDYFLMLVRQ